jgi:sugar lactone lactonase YvrE
MSVSPVKILGNSFVVKLAYLSLLPLFIGASSAWGAVPAVIIDSQETFGEGFNNPQAIVVNGTTNQGAVFVADTGNNQIIAVVGGNKYLVQPQGFTLTNPQALALDAQGDLFIGDTPTISGNSVGRIIEMTADATRNLTGAAKVIFSGAPLTNPTSLTIDSAGTLFIGDFPPSGNGAIYSLAAGAPAPTLLSITGGPPAQFVPSALLRDSSSNLYFADNGNLQGSNGAVYIVPAIGGTAQRVATQSFAVNQPTGLALNAAGDLYILTLLGTGSGYNAGQQIIVVPAASSTPYILPSSGINTGSGMAFDANGNLHVLDSFKGQVVQLAYGVPPNMGGPNVGKTGFLVLFNFEFNAPTTLGGFRVVTEGDVSTDLTQLSGGNCTNGVHNHLPNGGPAVSPYFPYTCSEPYAATPTYAGLHSSAILVRGAKNTILAEEPVYLNGTAGVEVTYPLTATITATDLEQPQALAVSGENKTVYIADTQAGKVYSTGGPGSTTVTPVSTGNLTLQAPIALALDGAGNLFIADYALGEVIEVPTTTGFAPSVVIPPGGLLQHPIALTVDTLGNLYVGDGGPVGFLASNSNPGYVVKLPAGGTPFKMTIPSVPVVFPQALAIYPYSNALYIGDGGDPSGVGQVVEVTADGTAAFGIPVPNVTNPTGLVFDPAGDLYVLDGTANTITVDPVYIPGGQTYPLLFDTTVKLSAASALAISAGGQSFVIANIGTGQTNNLVYLNGNTATLPFGTVPVGTQSQSMTAYEYNIGNLTMTLASPYYKTNAPNTAFTILGSSTCGANVVLNGGVPCTINVQFTPKATGLTTQQITVDSNAFNSGVPVLTLQGTGGAAGGVAHHQKN